MLNTPPPQCFFFPVKIEEPPVKKIRKSVREKKSARENFRQNLPVKIKFVPVKNYKPSARERSKSVREKIHNFTLEIYQ